MWQFKMCQTRTYFFYTFGGAQNLRLILYIEKEEEEEEDGEGKKIRWKDRFFSFAVLSLSLSSFLCFPLLFLDFFFFWSFFPSFLSLCNQLTLKGKRREEKRESNSSDNR